MSEHEAVVNRQHKGSFLHLCGQIVGLEYAQTEPSAFFVAAELHDQPHFRLEGLRTEYVVLVGRSAGGVLGGMVGEKKESAALDAYVVERVQHLAYDMRLIDVFAAKVLEGVYYHKVVGAFLHAFEHHVAKRMSAAEDELQTFGFFIAHVKIHVLHPKCL